MIGALKWWHRWGRERAGHRLQCALGIVAAWWLMEHPILVEVLRGGVVESIHRGSVAVVDSAGCVVGEWGDIDVPIFPRSAVKVLQALPLIESGAAERFGLSDEALALACASHSGEPAHTQVAAAVLASLGLDHSALECGSHPPKYEPAAYALAAAGLQPNALHNNCSGKHTGFVCLACHLNGGSDRKEAIRGYIRREHPAMREVTAALAAATGFDIAAAPQGIDGCSIPTFGIPLRHLALAFARVATGQGLRAGHARAAKRLREAVAKAPFMVGGTDRFDTQVMQAFGERVFCKIGAEGVYCAALPERGIGIALKVDDGHARAAQAVMADLIARFVYADDAQSQLIAGLRDSVLTNWRGVEVGRVRVVAGWSEQAAQALTA